jgi:hypothetical protein
MGKTQPTQKAMEKFQTPTPPMSEIQLMLISNITEQDTKTAVLRSFRELRPFLEAE